MSEQQYTDEDAADPRVGWDLVHRDWAAGSVSGARGGGAPRRGLRRLIDAVHAVAQGVMRLVLRTALA